MKLPTHWKESNLGTACSIEIGGTPTRDEADYWDTDRQTENAWLSIRDMSSRVITETAEHISNLGILHSNTKLQPKGTILLSFKLTIGRVAIAGKPLYTNEAIAGLRPKKDLTLGYLYQGLHAWNLLQGVDQAVKGATLNKEKLKKIAISYPEDRAEQVKIAEILSTVDQAIEQTEALITKQQRIKTGLMQDLLTRGIDEHGDLRSEETHEFKDSPLGRIPVEWEIATLGNVIGPIISGWSPTCDSAPAAVGEWAILKTTACVWSGYEPNENKRLPSNLRGVYRIEVAVDDILITRKGPVDRVGVVVHVPETRSKLMVPDTVFKMRLKVDCGVTPSFLPLALESAVVQSDWFQKKIGLADAQVNLNHSILRSTQFPKPDPVEQQKIFDTIRYASGQLSVESEQLAKLSSLKTALMQDLLAGKVRVTSLLNEQKNSA